MQITEKLRHDILFALPKLSGKQAQKIADNCNVSIATVWRQWNKIKTGNTEIFENPIVVAIIALAAKSKPKVEKRHKKLAQLQEQLSAA